ncbi:precorrin-2 dehydrogenase/sirohydrochlorin ferrochelatase family protein [Maritalea myrionectae]|uniref:precorrin-2 dehydrogenase/sirohydrochlorin ferrochelatase family protein n=1 Tax=Maritalea myrionectae TaxID=454601 RepID=UPI0004039D76|nr:NAD(P)-dependent oxidoreductase [Maritalea myrionectae]
MNLPFLPHNRIAAKSRAKHTTARIGKLAVLPVFFDLNGENVLVIGGTDAAAWKAELLAAAGAHVLIHAPKLSVEFKKLIAQSPQHFSHRTSNQWDSDFADVKLIICDAADATEAKRVRSIASLYGLPVNIIDQPEYCDFQFGSIVNRSPLVIGISTHGAAPILGQAVRRRIEAILPNALEQWAAMAQRLRHTVMTYLPMGEKRRTFWEHFVDQAFAGAPKADTETQLKKRCLDLAIDKQAKDHGSTTITHIEYHERDPEMLTIKAIRALQAADMVVYDDNAPMQVLELARREAKRMPLCEFDEKNAGTYEAKFIVKLAS